ncbi:MAG: class I SAM-dependent methyltransferase [Planctomycetota bacterium]|jgi:SAM-dependent methyltransferase
MTPDRLINWITRQHQRSVFPRRTERIADALAELLPGDTRTLLDVGCGDGTIAAKLTSRRADVTVQGADVLARPQTAIPVTVFDGRRLPFETDSFDAVMLVDVLHHCDDPGELLAEVARVARRTVLVKDHIAAGPISRLVLRAMDWAGNRGHGVRLAYNYWNAKQWQQAWQDCGLTVEITRRKLKLYPLWMRWVLEWGKHFALRASLPETGNEPGKHVHDRPAAS